MLMVVDGVKNYEKYIDMDSLEKCCIAINKRPVVQHPHQVSWQWIEHDSAYDILQLSDYERSVYNIEGEYRPPCENGNLLSLRIEFELDKGTYATVALAQLLNSSAIINPISEHITPKRAKKKQTHK